MAFKLDKALKKRIDELVTDLRGAASDFQSEWDERTEHWQEGDTGNATTTWIEELHQAADDLEALSDKPD